MSVVVAVAVTAHRLQWAAHYLIRLLDVQLGGAMPPPLSIDTVRPRALCTVRPAS